MASELEGFPRRLKLLMDAENLSTRQLAERTGKKVSHSAIAQWISGENRATIEQVAHVARVFDWDPHELLYGRGAADVVDRLADLDAALRQVRRSIGAIAFAVGATVDAKAADLPSRNRGTG